MSTVEVERRGTVGAAVLRGLLVGAAAVGAAVWLFFAPHSGGALADAWEPTSGGSSCLAQSQPASTEVTFSIPINPAQRVTLRDVGVVGARGLELVGAFVVPDTPDQQVALGWRAGGQPAAGAVVGGGVGRSLVLHLHLTDPAAARFDGLRLTTREGVFTYRTELRTGLRVGPPDGCR